MQQPILIIATGYDSRQFPIKYETISMRHSRNKNAFSARFHANRWQCAQQPNQPTIVDLIVSVTIAHRKVACLL